MARHACSRAGGQRRLKKRASGGGKGGYCGVAWVVNVELTTVPLSDFTAAGLMKGTTVGVAPPDAEVLDMARVLLGMR